MVPPLGDQSDMIGWNVCCFAIKKTLILLGSEDHLTDMFMLRENSDLFILAMKYFGAVLRPDDATCGTPTWIGKGLTCVCFKRKGTYQRICINLTPQQASSS
ncbi:hypothetical protein Pint_23715 [Pistacia integerrima]|uniref:Uncharacterized protein n=1 Tax=Pistacia integerrima TaxID=434235 RepID=A0ACC0YL68_9ROSI|nr:hypothetical protein Pint_23715 [Pistacia integerrima]